MAEIEIEDKTVEDAIRTGLEKLGCSRENVEVKILNEGTPGLFGLMGNKPARILITTKPGVETAEQVDYALVQAKVREILDNILKLMKINYSEIKTALLTGRVMAEIKSADSSLIIGKNGQTLEALEHVLNLILNRDINTRTKVSLDTESYRQKQEERFIGIAAKAAEQVKSSGKTFRFEPMPARDRRLIHMALKNNPDVETFSEGEGMFRKVGIKLKKKN